MGIAIFLIGLIGWHVGMDWLVKLTLRSAQPSVLSGVKRMLGFGYIFTDLTTESLQPLMEVIRSVVR